MLSTPGNTFSRERRLQRIDKYRVVGQKKKINDSEWLYVSFLVYFKPPTSLRFKLLNAHFSF